MVVPATLKKLQKELKPIIDASPFRVEIALQDGGHRWIARIFWPYAKFPAFLWDNQFQESHNVHQGQRCIEYKLCSVDQPTYEDLHYSGCDFWGDLRLGLREYLTWLWTSQDPCGPRTEDVGPSGEDSARTVTLHGVRGMIEKTVKAQGSSGRIYVPPSWVGKRAVVLLLDDE